MSKENSLFLKILDLEPEELKTILTVAVHLLYADGLAEIEEWNILSLLPALLDVIKEDSPGELRQEWEEKLAIANSALEGEGIKTGLQDINIKKKIKTPEKREVCLLLLFVLATSDRKVHRKELEFIMEYIARPWNIPKDRLVLLVKNAENEIRDAQTLIRMIKDYA